MKRTVIYEPRGKAGEYAPLALNLYRGCLHSCRYCFAPTATFTDRATFHDPSYIEPRTGVLEDLEEQARRMAGDKREILLSFTSDPYQPLERGAQVTRRALEILMSRGLTATILTKGGIWGLERDKDLLTLNPANAWSVTLTHHDRLVAAGFISGPWKVMETGAGGSTGARVTGTTAPEFTSIPDPRIRDFVEGLVIEPKDREALEGTSIGHPEKEAPCKPVLSSAC